MYSALRRFTGNGALKQLGELAKEGSADSNEASTEDASLFLSKEDISEPEKDKVHKYSLTALPFSLTQEI